MKLYDIIEKMNTPQRAMLQSPLWDSETFCNVSQEYFENREYIGECDTEAETITRFLTSYTTWLGLFSDNLGRVADLISTNYDPLENYSSITEGTKTTEMHKGSKTSFETDADVTTDASLFNGLKNIGKGNSKGSKSKNYTEVTDIDSTHFDKNVETFNNYKIHGNMSMRSTQDFYKEEIDLRLNDYIFAFINLFINSCTLWGD